MLSLEGLRAGYGPIEALRGLDLAVREGELVCLLGANGAGKSSTLRAISGLLPARAGRIVFDGTEIQGRDPAEVLRSGIAHCPEGRRVFPYLTVRENLAMGAFVRRDGAAVADDLERVYAHFPILADRRRQAAGTLSGGEQQMLAIGRAMIADIRRAGTTVLIVEQNARLALRMADRGYVMEAGRIVLAGSARELLNNDHVRAAYLGG